MAIITFTSKHQSSRPRPRAGDRRIVNGVVYVRKQKRYDGCLVVSNGRPVYEWVKQEVADVSR
jgi:hypothetical protein